MAIHPVSRKIATPTLIRLDLLEDIKIPIFDEMHDDDVIAHAVFGGKTPVRI
jgi:hypothetical protein